MASMSSAGMLDDIDSSTRDNHHPSPGGQRHDRIHDGRTSDSPAIASRDSEDAPDGGDISVAQKMLSAVSGSILTSLLVTPLDVVRVRLQSQHHPSSSTPRATPAALTHTPTPFTNLPPSLGISTCCREVFWINNNAPYCVASPNIALLNNPAATPSTAAECAAEDAQNRTFTTTLDGLRKIAKHEGPRTLWRGLSPTLVMAVPANVIYFAGYDWLRYSAASPLRRAKMSDTYAPLLAGSTARVLAAIAVSPIEMFRTRMQATSSRTAAQNASGASYFMQTLNDLREMVAANGPRSLWRGLTLTLWRDVPFSALYWWGYEAGRNVLTDMREQAGGRERMSTRSRESGVDTFKLRNRSRSRENHTATLIDSFVAGAASGAVAALVTTPFDVGKTRQQVIRHAPDSSLPGASSSLANSTSITSALPSTSSSASGPAAGAAKRALRPEELSMPRFLRHIFKEQGMSGLFRGWAARCLKVAPACAIMISSYEVGKKMAGGVNDRRERLRYAEE